MNDMKGVELPSKTFQFLKCVPPPPPVRSIRMSDMNSVWKPLRGPIKDWPLAVCDSSSLEDGDMREADIVFGDRVIENYLVQFNPKQKWYYLSDQTSDEAWVFLQAGSDPEGLRGKDDCLSW